MNVDKNNTEEAIEKEIEEEKGGVISVAGKDIANPTYQIIIF